MINETLQNPEKKPVLSRGFWGENIIRKGGGAKKVLELIQYTVYFLIYLFPYIFGVNVL